MLKQMNKIVLFVALALVLSVSLAAKKDANNHQHHSMSHGNATHKQMSKVVKGGLNKLKVIPDSGKTREAGFDGRYVMEATSVSDRLNNRCALASRGIIMLDNAAWAACGGKPKGASMGPKKRKKAMRHQH